MHIAKMFESVRSTCSFAMIIWTRWTVRKVAVPETSERFTRSAHVFAPNSEPSKPECKRRSEDRNQYLIAHSQLSRKQCIESGFKIFLCVSSRYIKLRRR